MNNIKITQSNMKNLFLLPTVNTSRLILQGTKLLLSKYKEVNEGFSEFNQHLYITSKDEIKDGFYLDLTHNMVMQSVFYPSSDKNAEKIILTTDENLIKNGVQAIDEEFLEWFVNNSSCEYVEWSSERIEGSFDGEYWSFKYGTVIPKEEPKQKVICTNDICQGECGECNFMTTINVEKQETLEEVAKTFVKNRFTKQICGDEFYPDIYASKEAIAESHVLFTKWQQERMYSEEDVIDIFFLGRESLNKSLITKEEALEVIKHFKNK